MNNVSGIFLCMLIMSSCTLDTVKKSSSKIPSQVASARNLLMFSGQDELIVRMALRTITEYEYPYIEARFASVAADGDGRFYCTFKYVQLKIIVEFSDGKYVKSTNGDGIYSGFNNEQQFSTINQILSPDQLRCKGDFHMEIT